MDFIKGGALFAVIIGFWEKIKSFLWFLFSIFIEMAEIKKEDTCGEIIGYLFKYHKYIKNYDKVFSSRYEYFRNGKYGLVPYESYGNSTVIFFTNKKFFFGLIRFPFIYTTNSFSKSGNNESSENVEKEKKAYIFSIRGTFDIYKKIDQAIKLRNSQNWNLDGTLNDNYRFNVYYFPERKTQQNERSSNSYGYTYYWYLHNQYKLIGLKKNELGKEKINKGNALNNLYFPNEIKNLINEIEMWINSKDWYRSKNIPWKKGWLLYGEPGTGKTALTRAFAEDLNLPIYNFSLSQLSNDDFINSWQSMQLNIPCIALIEDIDNVFDKRKNISLKNLRNSNTFINKDKGEVKYPLNFDTLLNCLDGVDKSEGVFTIITTNDITKIDEAIGVPSYFNNKNSEYISSRPGRIDRAIKLTYINEENKINMAKSILEEFPDALKIVLTKHIFEKKQTPAQFQEFCANIALKEYWNKVNLNLRN